MDQSIDTRSVNTSASGVAKRSRTPTDAALRLFIENWRWAGVPFCLRSGKALAGKSSDISIEFKRSPTQMFGTFQTPTPNVLSICVQPDRVTREHAAHASVHRTPPRVFPSLVKGGAHV